VAGVSIDYYIRLEQGRELNPSAEVLGALARALRLDEDAHAHLFALANHAAHRAVARFGPGNRAIPAATRLLLEKLRPCPAQLLSRTSDVLASNPEGLALLAGLAEWEPQLRNTIRYVFLHPHAHAIFDDWEHAAASGVANLHMVLADDPGAPDLAALVTELIAASTEFTRLWNRYDIAPRRSSRKIFHHPSVGEMTLEHEVVRLDGGERIAIYLALPGSPSAEALTLLSLEASAVGRV
jgi:transcriptional regulator with XRE-family HTH domain